MTAPYPELTSIPLDRPLADGIAAFVAPLERGLSWRDASKIPRTARKLSRARAALAVAAAVFGGHHLYVSAVPGHHVARRTHAAIRGPRASRLYEFLCLNRTIDAQELSFAHDGRALDAFAASQAVIRRDDQLLLPVTLSPWGDRYYFTESLHLRENAHAYGSRGAPLDPETDVQIRWLRRTFAGRTFDRFLELGTGTGVVLLELAGIARHLEGGEFEHRSLGFAIMNGHRHAPAARFFWTDLFSGARGRYDLVHFAPWHPSESSLHLLLGFLDQLGDHLTPAGEAVMFVSHYGDARDDVVLTPLARKLAERGFVATQDVVHAFTDGAGRLAAQSFLHLRRGTAREVITTKPSPALAWFQARRAAAALRSV